jgi:hypothetical protein
MRLAEQDTAGCCGLATAQRAARLLGRQACYRVSRDVDVFERTMHG